MLEPRRHELRNIRTEYLNQRTTTPNMNPINEFNNWLAEAMAHGQPEPTAMSLSTVDAGQQPRTRIVLLKDIREDKFVFYTNYNSRKALDLKDNPNVSLVFWWHVLSRQIIIQGRAHKISEEESINYFNTRPFESKLGAIVSPQSQQIDTLDNLINKVEQLRKQYQSKPSELPKPQHWGGYEITPNLIEFWKGMGGRLHERIEYKLNDTNTGWHINFLAP